MFDELPCEFVSKNESETFEFAKQFASVLQPADFVAMFGGLGAGKTLFVKGLCEGLGFKGHVSSPTFALIHEYRPTNVMLNLKKVVNINEFSIVHCDMYRIKNEFDLESTGFFDYLANLNKIIVVEWSEHIVNFLPNYCYRINFNVVDDCRRRIKIEKGV